MGSTVVLCSGGVDSALLLAWAAAADDVAAVLFFAYGQPAALAEWRAVRTLKAELAPRAPMVEVNLASVLAPAMRASTGAAGPRVVPARNAIMLAHGANYAAGTGAARVWHGANGADQAEYHDCRAEFFAAMNLALAGDGVRVEAPLLARPKSWIVREADKLGLRRYTVSCYTPALDGSPCGTCGSCLSLDAAAVEAAR